MTIVSQVTALHLYHISSNRSWVSNTSRGSDWIVPIQAGSQI